MRQPSAPQQQQVQPGMNNQNMDQFVQQMNAMAAQQGMFGNGPPMGMPMIGMPNPMMMNHAGNWGGMGYPQQQYQQQNMCILP